MTIKYDNEGDRFLYGRDLGIIRDGTVTLDSATGRYVIVDNDGVGLDVQTILESMIGQKLRLTIASLEALRELEEAFNAAQQNKPS